MLTYLSGNVDEAHIVHVHNEKKMCVLILEYLSFDVYTYINYILPIFT